LSFFDEGDEPRTKARSPRPQPRRPASRARRGRVDDRTLLARRGVAAAIVLAVLIGGVLGIKAILDHQALAGLNNYASNVEGVVQSEPSAVRDPVFRAIDNSYASSNAIDVTTALQQYASQEQSSYHDAQGWSVPSQMAGAQRYFVEMLGLRAEALADIESQMSSVLGTATHAQHVAIDRIAGDMYKLGASDVLYSDRVVPLVTQELAGAGATPITLPGDAFLPDVGWLVPQTVAQRILGFVPASLGGTPPPPGANVGHALLSVGVQTPSGLQSLSTTTINRLAYTSAGITFVLRVENAGTLAEHDVQTTLTFFNRGVNTSSLGKPTGTIRETFPGQQYNSSILFAPASCTALHGVVNQVLLMTAGVTPIPGENLKSNNYMHFDVEFTC